MTASAGNHPGASPQLPLALRFPPDQRFETYINAPPGALPQLRALALQPAQDWVFLSGPGGVGKTHLLLSTCAEASAAGRRVAYLSLHTAAGRLGDALQALEGNDVVALDNVQAIVGNRDDEIALFDAHNRARTAGTGILYASRENPAELPLLLPDLRSRLSQCARIALAPLDDDGRREVLAQRAQRRGLIVDDAALDWLLRRTGRDLVGLTGMLERLDRASLAEQRKLTVPFLRKVLGNTNEG
ncbi:DnaA regulatory inactivator Hda [Pseudoxanthomonas dokdonensis]|uniref:Uncharacterized protein n=1 Tax=Pseudoxanthomonas dokdonensis TaxID=344882 RepID=A0A0R0CQR0_9GAMM|nr:DnaA regulatory inactivator Hda [Pseudoxanthomonas dokdonensis]KRG67985.1 hypothetical protein ABB29_14485 [Pseudoxanthomonas dokdonensis]